MRAPAVRCQLALRKCVHGTLPAILHGLCELPAVAGATFQAVQSTCFALLHCLRFTWNVETFHFLMKADEEQSEGDRGLIKHYRPTEYSSNSSQSPREGSLGSVGW